MKMGWRGKEDEPEALSNIFPDDLSYYQGPNNFLNTPQDDQTFWELEENTVSINDNYYNNIFSNNNNNNIFLCLCLVMKQVPRKIAGNIST